MVDNGSTDGLHYREISELVEMLAAGDVSARQLTALSLDRIATVDSRLGSFAFVAADEAMKQATESDERRKAGTTRGPLDGIPLAIKDVYDKAAGPPKPAWSCAQVR